MTDYLSDRERYIVDNHPQKTYAALGAQFGICPERVRQIKHAALRKIKEEKRRERVLERGQELVTLTLPRHDVWLILRSLHAYQFKIHHADMRRKDQEPDPDEAPVKNLMELLNNL